MWIRLTGLLWGLLALPALMVAPAHGQTVINADDRGWYNASGTHSPANNNSFTGAFSGNVYRSYYRFAVPAGVTCLSDAVLELELENYYGSGVDHISNVFDVSPGNVPLLDTTNGSGSGVAIFTDIGSGVAYGTVTGVNAADIGSLLTFSLPASALADIVAAAGGNFAVGAATVPGDTSNLSALRYSAGNESRVHRLTLTACPALPQINAAKTVDVHDPMSLGLYAVPGNDVIYTLTVNNSGPGVVDADAMFLVDKIPEEIAFYNGDIFDGDVPTDPVFFSETDSGLTFDYATDVGYSNLALKPVNFAACNYVPAAGYDTAGVIKYICFNPKEEFASGSPSPEFSVSFRGRIK